MKFLTTITLVFTCLCLQAQSSIHDRNYVEYSVNISPNPSDGPIQIDAPVGSICKMVSLNGDYVGSWKVAEGGIRIDSLEPGKYIIETTFKGKTTTKKIIIL